MSGTATHSAVRELDHRSTDGLEVTLQWHAGADVVSVAVFDVFHHPYAYAASRRTAHEDALPVAA